MTIDNVVFWTLLETKMTKFYGDEERFKQSMPELFRAIQREGMSKYGRYQVANGLMHKRYRERCAEWRKNEFRRIRHSDKLRAISGSR